MVHREAWRSGLRPGEKDDDRQDGEQRQERETGDLWWHVRQPSGVPETEALRQGSALPGRPDSSHDVVAEPGWRNDVPGH